MKDEKKEQTEQEIRRNFNAAYHPDKWPNATPEAKKLLHEIVAEQNAYLDKHKGQKLVQR
jgi:hypothetical protein